MFKTNRSAIVNRAFFVNHFASYQSKILREVYACQTSQDNITVNHGEQFTQLVHQIG